MSELLVTINASASRKNGFVVLQTYETKEVVVNKFGKYKGGSISDLDVLNCPGVSNVDNNWIGELFSRFCFKLSCNAFYIAISELVKFRKSISERLPLFIDNTDRSMLVISNIRVGSPTRKSKYQYKIGPASIICTNDGMLWIDGLNAEETIFRIEPVPILVYNAENKVYTLFFEYKHVRMPYCDQRLSVRDGDVVCLRDAQLEENIVNRLSGDFKKLTKGRFLYCGREKPESLKSILQSQGVTLSEDGECIVPEVKIKRGEDGWFEIDLFCRNNGAVIDLATRIDLFSSKNAIEFDGKKIVLPESIANVKDEIVRDGRRLKIADRNIFSLLHIIYDSGAKIDDFYRYSDVRLKLEKSLLSVAYPYQIEGIKWLKFLFLNHIGGCLADDMGLGKTFQIISFLCDWDIRKKVGKVLIVVPKSLLTNWVKEFEKFGFGYRVQIYHGLERQKFDFDACDVVITTYNTALLDEGVLCRHIFTVAIFDEIQMVKNRNSTTSASMKRIKAEVRFGLSGTPMENNIAELWNVMDVINPGVFSSYDSFCRRYSNSNYDELRTILSLFVMRRTKNNVLKELPPKLERIVYCDMDQAQRKLYSGINMAVKRAIENLKVFAAPIVLKGLTLLRECCCHPGLLSHEVNVDNVVDSCKLDALYILVDDLFKSGHKMLIFSGWTSMLGIIRSELMAIEAYRDHIYYLDGKTRNRSDVIGRFESADSGIFLISIKAAGVGLNLVSAQDVIIYDPWWNPFVEQQAIDRAYRIGQDKPVTVYKLVTVGTLEEKIVDMEDQKKKNFDEIINGISSDKNMKLENILRLF